MDLKEYIIEKSKELNIDIIGFCRADAFENLEEILRERQNKSYHTEFEIENITKRINPKTIIPTAKTIICIGIAYNTNYKRDKEIKLKGNISRSSWGIDYHKVLREKLENLVGEIKKVTKLEYKIYVDTGPLVDREIAKRAGIGWYGKNCSIINNDYGSFIFIGYMITDLELKEDSPIEESCGDCTLCIDACPTGAIEKSYIINSKKCISYLTQTNNKIPFELRDKMGIKVYGCDTCQLVCPKNKGVSLKNNEDFLPKKTHGYIDIEELFKMSSKEFKEKYGDMAGSWRGKNILKRNSLIALGNIKKGFDIAKKAIKDESSKVREYAAWALMKIDKDRGKIIIKEHLRKEKDIGVRHEMERILDVFSD